MQRRFNPSRFFLIFRATILAVFLPVFLLLQSGCQKNFKKYDNSYKNQGSEKLQKKTVIPLDGYLHTVQSEGETLGVIAQWYTGKSSNWRKIAEQNPHISNPAYLRPGMVISIDKSLIVRDEIFSIEKINQSKTKKAEKTKVIKETKPALAKTTPTPKATKVATAAVSPTFSPTATTISSPTSTLTSTPTMTPTYTPTSTPTYTPTYTPFPEPPTPSPDEIERDSVIDELLKN